MEIHIQHPAVNDGVETPLDIVRMTDIYEPPPTRGGLRDMAEVHMGVFFNSPAHKMLNAVYRSRNPMRLRTDGHVGMWLIRASGLPGIPSDGCASLTLCFSGSADTL